MVERCPNCGSEQVESYCASCGQRAGDLRTSISEFLREAVDEVFSLDSRVWRTLIALFRHPGLLTADYRRGRRARFVTPLRLYLIVSFVTFLFLVLRRAEQRARCDRHESLGAAEDWFWSCAC